MTGRNRRKRVLRVTCLGAAVGAAVVVGVGVAVSEKRAAGKQDVAASCGIPAEPEEGVMDDQRYGRRPVGAIPPIDRTAPARLETATFSLG